MNPNSGRVILNYFKITTRILCFSIDYSAREAVNKPCCPIIINTTRNVLEEKIAA